MDQNPSDSSPHTTTAHITEATILTPTINAWQIYLNDQALSPHTVKAFTADLRLFASYLPADKKIGEISYTDINNFLDWMQHKRDVPCSPKTLARRITSIKSFFRWLTSNGVLVIDPSEKIPQKTVISPLPQVLNPSEYDAVLQSAVEYRYKKKSDTRYYTLVSLLLSTGIKKGECLNLSPNHIDLTSPVGAQLFVRYDSPQHRYKERKISLPDSWVESYMEYKEQYTLLDRLFPWSPRRLEYLLEDLSNDSGIEKHLSFDMCRWTCALNDWQAGMEHEKIRQKLGVSKVQWREINQKLRKLSSQVGDFE